MALPTRDPRLHAQQFLQKTRRPTGTFRFPHIERQYEALRANHTPQSWAALQSFINNPTPEGLRILRSHAPIPPAPKKRRARVIRDTEGRISGLVEE